jgi:hypothetical protein
MILTWLYWCVLVVSGVKIAGNLVLPYGVLRLKEDEGISLAFVLLGDIFLSSAVVTFALIIDRAGSIYEFRMALMLTFGAVTGSYIHYFVVLSVATIIGRKRSASKTVDKKVP